MSAVPRVLLRLWPLGIALALLMFVLAGVIQWRSEEIPGAYALDTQSGDGLIIYAQNGNINQGWRTYASTTNTFSSEIRDVATGSARTFQLRTSPSSTEAVAGFVSSTGVLQVLCYNGTRWTREWSVTVGPGATTTRFDIAYETNSGDAIVVYSANAATTNELRYRTKAGTTTCGSGNWSAEQNLDPARTTGIVHWVKMASDRRTSSDLIALSWADQNRDLSAMVWSSSAFGNEPSNVSSANLEIITAIQDIDPFDIDYESLSGDVMMVWSTSTGSDTVNSIAYRTCNGGTSACSWGAITAMPTVANEGSSLDIAANPGSNEIIFGSISNASPDLQAAWWSGGAWTGTNELDTAAQGPTSGTKMVAAGWVTWGSASRSVIVYQDSATTNIGFVTGTNGILTLGTDATPSPVFATPQKWYDIRMNPLERHKLMLTVQDNNSDLFAKRLFYNGSTFTWTNADGGAALEATLPGSRILPMGAFDYWRKIPAPTSTQNVYRWFNNADSLNVGSPLAIVNASATLALINQPFRLRLLLRVGKNKVPDDLGQRFKLQYVGKGTGTCASPSGGTPSSYTDVTNATLIAFNDNASAADGGALTSNVNDPADSGRTIVNQTYVESNSFLATQGEILSGQDGKWDVALESNNAPLGTTYCFRVVYSDNSLLESYVEYPEIRTALEATVSLSSAADQEFATGDAATAIQPITITNPSTSTMSATNDIRVRIPSGFPMSWDPSDTLMTIAPTLDEYTSAFSTNDMPVVTADFSGVAYSPITGTIFTVVNGTPQINEYTIGGAHLRTITMSGFTDTEGIDWMYDNTFVVAQERVADPTLIMFQVTSTTVSITKSIHGTVITPSMTISDNGGMEGVRYDAARDLFYVSVEKQSAGGNGGRVFQIEMDGATTEFTTLGATLLAAGYTDLADLAFDPITKNLFLLSQEQNTIIEATASGTIVRTRAVDTSIFTQPEGVELSPDGDTLFVVGEADDYQRLTRSLGVTSTVSFEDSNKTLVIDITGTFASGTQLIFGDLAFTSFTSASSAGRLELVTTGAGGSTTALDDKILTITGSGLAVAVVDALGDPIALPTVAFENVGLSVGFQSTTGTLGTSAGRLRVTNSTGGAQWSLSLAATDGATAFWDGASTDYDFNDPTASAGDGGDADSFGGQMTVTPTGATITPEGGCSATGLSLASPAAFSQGVTDSVSLLTAGGSAEIGCYWDITGIDVMQTIPAQKPVGDYEIGMTLTVVSI